MLSSTGAGLKPGMPTVSAYRAGAFFHVHGHIVHKALVQDLRQPGRITAVGIQLHRIVQSFDLLEKIGQIRIQSRFTAGNTYALQNGTRFFRKSSISSREKASKAGSFASWLFWQKGQWRLQPDR